MRIILALTIALSVTPVLAKGGKDACTQYRGGVVYLRGKPSTWPMWAQASFCVKPWAENPMHH